MAIKIPKAKRKIVPKESKKKFSKSISFKSLKGMHDVLPADFLFFDRIEKALKDVSSFYNFLRIETPILEELKMFERGTGLTSEVVSKQMFVVKTRGGDTLALRPEMTPGVLRAYLENGLNYVANPGKFFYYSPVFRYEQPQAGRFRQFHQVGFEILSSDDPIYDAQVISASYKVISELKIKNLLIKINSIGCKNCRPAYLKKIKNFYKDKLNKICKDCRKRYSENPLRMLDCKEQKCQEIKAMAPVSLDTLCSSCKHHFTFVLEFLDEIKIPYIVDSCLVRGLDYYSKTVFEVFAEGFDFALGGGGRYDYLSESLGGPKLPAVGSALGVERIIEVMKARDISGVYKNKFRVFLVYMGDQAKKRALSLMDEFYEKGVQVKESFSKDSLKAQMKSADKEKVDFALILGQREVFEDVIILRDMRSGSQENIPLRKIADELKKRMH